MTLARSWLGVVLALAACTEARQITLSIDTPVGVPCEIDHLRFRATSSATTTTFERTLGGSLPITVPLLDETPDGRFTIEVTGIKDDVDQLVARGDLTFADHKVTVPIVLESDCSADAPCEIPASAPIGPRLRCGPKVTRYAVGPSVETFQDACVLPGAANVLIDSSRGPVKLDALESALRNFQFSFYGRPIQQIWVHRDGYISFDRDNPDPNGDLDPGPLDRVLTKSGPPPPQRSVMAFWDTLSLRPNVGVCYALQGAPGSQVFRATWRHACLTETCGADDINFTISLDEASQTIGLTYEKMAAGNPDRARGFTATVGLVNDANGCIASQCAVETGLCSDGHTPCGYSQIFSQVVQTAGVQNEKFTPIPESK
jgi:hypothetical protein